MKTINDLLQVAKCFWGEYNKELDSNKTNWTKGVHYDEYLDDINTKATYLFFTPEWLLLGFFFFNFINIIPYSVFYLHQSSVMNYICMKFKILYSYSPI